MDQHPIPQNIASFEFHLVGDMTLKQFGYLASGLTVAYLTFAFLFTVNPFVAVPIIAVSFMTGAAFAFLPISDRPLDHWLGAFLRATFSPTQGYWKPTFAGKGRISPTDPSFQNRLATYLSTLAELQPSPQPFTIPPLTSPPDNISPAGKPAGLPTKEELNTLVNTAAQIQTLKQKAFETAAQTHQLETARASSPAHNPLSEKQLSQLAQNLEGIVDQTKDVYKQTLHLPEPAQQRQAPKVLIVPPPQKVTKQVLLTSTPNVVNGIVMDQEGGYMENVIVIVHDKDELPVRALKTNKLGQFTGATPLPTGTYTLSLEKDGLVFDAFQITLNGEVLPPIRVTPKKGGN